MPTIEGNAANGPTGSNQGPRSTGLPLVTLDTLGSRHHWISIPKRHLVPLPRLASVLPTGLSNAGNNAFFRGRIAWQAF